MNEGKPVPLPPRTQTCPAAFRPNLCSHRLHWVPGTLPLIFLIPDSAHLKLCPLGLPASLPQLPIFLSPLRPFSLKHQATSLPYLDTISLLL